MQPLCPNRIDDRSPWQLSFQILLKQLLINDFGKRTIRRTGNFSGMTLQAAGF